MKKIIIPLIAIALVFIGLRSYYRSIPPEIGDEGETKPHTTVSKRIDILQQVDAAGVTAPLVQTDVKSEINGRIERIYIKEGEVVEQNQSLIQLDTRSLEAELDEAKKRFEAQKIRVEKSKRDFERLEKLANNNFARESEYLDAQTNYTLAQLELEIQQARLDSTLDKLDKALIRAPHAGTVLNFNLNEGQVITGASSVSNGTLLMQIADITRLKVDIDLNEVDINKVKLGDPAVIRFDAIQNETFKGTVTAVTTGAVFKNNARVFPTTISIDQVDTRIKPGISANISLSLEKAEDVVGVILSAVFIGEDKETQQPERFVYVINDASSMEKRTVTTGISDKQHIEIKSGLEADVTLSLVRPSKGK